MQTQNRSGHIRVETQTGIEAPDPKTLTQRRREFNKTYKQWLMEQSRDFEHNGLWSDGLVAWRDHGR